MRNRAHAILLVAALAGVSAVLSHLPPGTGVWLGSSAVLAGVGAVAVWVYTRPVPARAPRRK